MYRILVVDDMPDVQSTLKGTLEDAGHTVETASNEAEALRAVRNNRFDFALIDLRLHGNDDSDESGLNLTLWIRELAPQIQIILMTQFENIKYQKIARAIRYNGAVNFIRKSEDNYKNIAQIISETRKNIIDATRFSLALTNNKPTYVRSNGAFVYANFSQNELKLDTEQIARDTEIAGDGLKYFRFQIKKIGTELWNEIFVKNPEILVAFNKAKAIDKSLLLRFEAPIDCLRIPLEFLRAKQADDYLVLQNPFSRLIYDISSDDRGKTLSPASMAQKDKLRILIIASNTWDEKLCPIEGVEMETEQLKSYIKSLETYIQIDVEHIPTKEATYKRVQSELKACNYDIVHYAGHGWHNSKSPEESCLFFWSDDNHQGKVKKMTANELKMLLDDSTVGLFYLSCCQGSAAGEQSKLLDDDFLGLAHAIVQAGVLSIVGYRWPVSDAGAIGLAQAFYYSLIDQGSPEIALWHARRELAAIDRNDPTWLSPILIHQQ